jgi:hypothetical protein
MSDAKPFVGLTVVFEVFKAAVHGHAVFPQVAVHIKARFKAYPLLQM